MITGQGVLVSTSDAGAPLLLDDGTGVIHLSLSGDFRLRPWKTGMYVMVVGGYIASSGEPPMIKVQNKTPRLFFLCVKWTLMGYCWTLDYTYIPHLEVIILKPLGIVPSIHKI